MPLHSAMHDSAWKKAHGRSASANAKLCKECHDDRKCASCHMGTNRKLAYHANDWIVSHGIYAKKKTLDCAGCHTAQNYCLGCYERTGAGPYGDRKASFISTPSGQLDSLGTPGVGPEGHRHMRGLPSGKLVCQMPRNLQHKSGPGASTHASEMLSKCGTYLSRNKNACMKCHTMDDVKARCFGTQNQP